MANQSNQAGPRLNQILVSKIVQVGEHVYDVYPIPSASTDIGLGTEAEFFDRNGHRISGKVFIPAGEGISTIAVSTLYTPSLRPVVEKIRRSLPNTRKVSARPPRERR